MTFLQRLSFLFVLILCQPSLYADAVPFVAVQEALKQTTDRDPLTAKTSQEKEVLAFYKERVFTPAWATETGWSEAARLVRDTLNRAQEEGLDPKDYTRSVTLLEKTPETAQDVLAAELALTQDALAYINDLKGERLNPTKIGQPLYLKPDPVDAPMILAQGIAGDPTGTWFQNLTVPKEQYQALKKLLAEYRAKLDTDTKLPTIPVAGKLLKKGMSAPDVALLRTLLKAHGFDPGDSTKPEYFDDALESALKRFQEASLLEDDGILGEQGRRALNRSVQEKLKQIIVSMERWRWLPEHMPERYVLVNIAGFELYAYDGGHTALSMPVIIGRDYRKTPVFSSTINSVRFNPSWGVPHSIAVKDKLPKLQSNPGYFVEKGYEIYDDSGAQVDPRDVNWTEISASDFHYSIRQNPGPANALGKIRFSIDSPFDVYLHDTSDPQLFAKKVRTFSSGCIRVSKPAELAFFVFHDTDKWPLEVIKKSMEGTQTRNVSLPSPVPVYITYFTVWVGPEGHPEFRDDIYNQDAAIYQALEKRTSRAAAAA